MRNLIKLLRGTVSVSVEGVFPERLINLCAQHRIVFWGVDWVNEYTVVLSVYRGDVKKLRQLGEKISCTITVAEERGLPFFLRRFRKRFSFLIGLCLSLFCVSVLSRVVLTVEVEGNETVPTAHILGELRRQGLYPGVYGPLLERKQIAQNALLSLEELSWLTINLYGTRAEVLVREVIKQPEILEKEGCYDIVAKADGMIMELEAHNGQSVVKEGDTVLEGDILISGTVRMEPPVYSDQPVRYYQTQARGRVWARTWRTLTAKIPLNTQIKGYTGEEKHRFAVNIFGWPMDFYRNSSISWPFYDKITTVYPILNLPVTLIKSSMRAYQPESVFVDWSAAQTLLEQQLYKRLEQMLGKDGTVESAVYSARVQDQWLSVTLYAQCQEEIGSEVPGQRSTEQPTE